MARVPVPRLRALALGIEAKMKEHEILKAFPLGGSFAEQRARKALFHALWAFENVEGYSGLVGTSVAEMVHKRLSDRYVLQSFVEDATEAAKVMRRGADRLADAAVEVSLILLDQDAARRSALDVV